MPGAADSTPSRRRFWCVPHTRRDEVVFDPDETRHLRKVMRLRAGDTVEAIDGSGRVLTVELLRDGTKQAHGRVRSAGEPVAPPELEIWLGQAIIRPARFELLLEKAVEIGIAGFIPVLSRFSHPARYLSATRRQRFERIARSAVAQSLGTRAPTIANPARLRDLDTTDFDTICVAHGPSPDAGVTSRLPALPRQGRLLVMVGPEGGWDTDEIADFQSRGAVELDLGRRRLRAETAAIVALTLVRWGLAQAPGGVDRR